MIETITYQEPVGRSKMLWSEHTGCSLLQVLQSFAQLPPSQCVTHPLQEHSPPRQAQNLMKK